MCFHGNQHPWAIKHPFTGQYSIYLSLKCICLPVVNSPIFPSLDDIYCTLVLFDAHVGFSGGSNNFTGMIVGTRMFKFEWPN